MKWSNITDYKWKSDNPVSSSCTVIMVGRFFSKEIFKIVATRCHLFRLKCTIFDFGEGGEGSDREERERRGEEEVCSRNFQLF